jgi:hypothetical protein
MYLVLTRHDNVCECHPKLGEPLLALWMTCLKGGAMNEEEICTECGRPMCAHGFCPECEAGYCTACTKENFEKHGHEHEVGGES